MASRTDFLLQRAEEYFEAARVSFKGERLAVAFEEARTAAELAAKSLLARAGVAYKKEHNVAGDLRARHLLPRSMSASALSDLLGDSSRGVYGFDRPVDRSDAKRAIALADQMLVAARAAQS